MKTIFKNERGVPTLHLQPETDLERAQLQNVVGKGRTERIFMRWQPKIHRNMPGGGISIGKCASITFEILNAWGFYRLWNGTEQFEGNDNSIYKSNRFPHTIIVGNGTFRVFHNVREYFFEGDRRFKLFTINPIYGKQIRKFVCRTADDLEAALFCNDYIKKKRL